MRPCPFCNQEVEARFPYMDYLKPHDVWMFNHHCHTTNAELDVCITVYGATEEEVIQKWNGDYHAEEQTSESL